MGRDGQVWGSMGSYGVGWLRDGMGDGMGDGLGVLRDGQGMVLGWYGMVRGWYGMVWDGMESMGWDEIGRDGKEGQF